MEMSNYGMVPHDSQPSTCRPAGTAMTKEAKTRAARRANRFSRWFLVAAFVCLGLTHSYVLFFWLAGLCVAVNFAAWRYFLKLERQAAVGGLVLSRPQDEE